MLSGYQGYDYTISDIEQAMGRNDQLDTLEHLRYGLNELSVITHINNYMLDEDIGFLISQGKPVIALIHYAKVPARYKIDQQYQGYHYVCVVGYTDDAVIYHDPLGYAGCTVPWKDWDYFFTGQALYPEVGILPEEVLDMTKDEFAEVMSKMAIRQAKLDAWISRGYVLVNNKGVMEVWKNGEKRRAYATPEDMRRDGWEFGDESKIIK
jgi:hypothetical protein